MRHVSAWRHRIDDVLLGASESKNWSVYLVLLDGDMRERLAAAAKALTNIKQVPANRQAPC